MCVNEQTSRLPVQGARSFRVPHEAFGTEMLEVGIDYAACLLVGIPPTPPPPPFAVPVVPAVHYGQRRWHSFLVVLAQWCTRPTVSK